MQRCLALAQQGRLGVRPNPMVGAVLLNQSGQVIAEGYHQQAGGPHAEIMAITAAQANGDDLNHATLVVNLEPCCHQGKTGPCTEAIIKAGITQVIVGCLDPNPKVAGQGIEALQQAGLKVSLGTLQAECLDLNEAFVWQHTQAAITGLPFVALKLALTLDGKVATRNHHSQWITGEASRERVHWLRGGFDAILTTAATVAADNPLMTVRHAELPVGFKPPVRIILDRTLRLNPNQYAIFNQTQTPTWVIHQANGPVNQAHLQALKALAIPTLGVAASYNALKLEAVLKTLYQKGLGRVWIEAGGQLAGAILAQKLAQRYYLVYGGKVLGDAAAPASFSGGKNTPIAWQMGQAQELKLKQATLLENDLWLEAVNPNSTAIF